MAKMFLVTQVQKVDKCDYPQVDCFIVAAKPDTYLNMVNWLIDNDINHHSEISDSNAFLVMKDEDAVAFKLRWME